MLESCECGTRAWTIATLFKDTSILYSAGGQHHGRLGEGRGFGLPRSYGRLLLESRECGHRVCMDLPHSLGTPGFWSWSWTPSRREGGGGGGGEWMGGGGEGALDYREAEVGCLSLESAGTECAWTM